MRDREARHKSVEAILAEAVLTDLHLPPEATEEERAAAMQKAQEAADEIATRLVFGRVSVRKKARQRKPQVSVVYFRNLELVDVDKDGNNGSGKGKVASLPADEPVQLAMFAM